MNIDVCIFLGIIILLISGVIKFLKGISACHENSRKIKKQVYQENKIHEPKKDR